MTESLEFRKFIYCKQSSENSIVLSTQKFVFPLWVVLIVTISNHVVNCLSHIDFISVCRLYLHKAESVDPSVLPGL